MHINQTNFLLKKSYILRLIDFAQCRGIPVKIVCFWEIRPPDLQVSVSLAVLIRLKTEHIL